MIEVTLSSQLSAFLWAVACGALAGAVYSVFAVLRMLFKNGRIATFFCDVCFMLIFAVITYIFSVGFTEGLVRVYVIIGEITGLLAFRFTLGALFQRLIQLFFSIFSKISGFLQKNISQIAKKLLKQTHNMLYNNHKKKAKLQNEGKEG